MKLSDWTLVQFPILLSVFHVQNMPNGTTQNLLDELADLSYLATMRPESPWNLPKRYHSQAKTLPICRRKLTAIFHIEGDYVIVDKILPSSLITY